MHYFISDNTMKIDLNSFEAIRIIGRGTFGKVYLVKKRDSGDYFAMKSIRKDVILKKN